MLNFYDRGSDFIWSDPVKSKDEPSTSRSFNFLMGSDVNVRLVYSDDHASLKATCRKLGILTRTSQPGEPQSNGMIESMNRRIIEGGRTALQQAGLPNCFWGIAGMQNGPRSQVVRYVHCGRPHRLCQHFSAPESSKYIICSLHDPTPHSMYQIGTGRIQVPIVKKVHNAK